MLEGWQEVRLGDVASVNPKESALSSQSPFFPMDSVLVGSRFPRYYEEKRDRGGIRCQGGDVLFARITPCLENGKVAQVAKTLSRCGGSTEFIVLRGSEQVISDFLYYWSCLPTIRKQAEALMVGTSGRKRISASDLSSLSIVLPPLEEQHRIVDLMESVDEAITSAHLLTEATKSVRSALLSNLLSPQRAFKEGWQEVRLGDVATVDRGISWGKEQESWDRSKEYLPVVRIGNVQLEGIDMTKQLYLKNVRESLILKSAIKPGTLLMIGSNGNPSRIGNVFLAPDYIYGYLYASFIIGIKPDSTKIVPKFVWAIMRSQSVQEDLTASTSGTTGLKNLSLVTLRSYKIPLPPLEEQHRIVDLTEAVDEQIQACQNYEDSLSQLRSGLLQDLLSGDHEIDPSYDSILQKV